MKQLAAILSVGMALVAPHNVCAQPVITIPPQMPATVHVDPVRLDLARQLLAVSGGQQQADAQLTAVFAGVRKSMERYSSPENGDVNAQLYVNLEQELLKLSPRLVELSVNIYASNFTEKELRDLIAFQTSESGQSIARKMPTVREQAVEATMPLIMALMPGLLHKTIDRVCEDRHCTTKQREAMVAVVTKALQQGPS